MLLLSLPDTAVADVVTVGETLAMCGARLASASCLATGTVRSYVCDVDDERPALTVRVLVPRAEIESATAFDEPLPTATSTITAATPMRMPRVVSTERMRLAVTPCHAARSTSTTLIG